MKDIEKIISKLLKIEKITYKRYRKILSLYPKEGKTIYSKSEILDGYNRLLKEGSVKKNSKIENFLKTKPTRTISGVTPVTVLTKPFKCPGKCIFCPTRQDQPKSYLSSEPGAMRAKMLKFDPFLQVKVRMQALKNIGHNTDKIELIILGGTWSSYPKKYQIWFIKECFRAMNKENDLNDQVEPVGSDISQPRKQLLDEQKRNETAKHRCVGLVVETRPDLVNKKEVKWLRYLGCTKIQLGVQSLDDYILKINKRGHTVADTKEAITLLRLAGFKLHLHWMLNLYGSNQKKDFSDFKKLFTDISIRPDELKIYPCLLLAGTKLFDLYEEGRFKPYSKKKLLELLIKCKQIIPRYCRVSRLFRDIPSFEIVKGVKETNFRQIVKEEMKKRSLKCNCIRCREIRSRKLAADILQLKKLKYKTSTTEEHFLSYETKDSRITGFLRLSLPFKGTKNFMEEIQDCAMIREVHVYGQSERLKTKTKKNIQHRGLGTKLIREAELISKKHEFKRIAVISAIGTRNYYEKRGYKLGKLYMAKNLTSS